MRHTASDRTSSASRRLLADGIGANVSMHMQPRTSITTKAGDRGTTYLFSGEEIPKDSLRTMAYGDLDELVSVLGVARCHARHEESREEILRLQQELFTLGAELATALDHVNVLKERITAGHVRAIEGKMEILENLLPPPDGFVIPGGRGALGAAHLDHARAVARRLERRAVSLARAGLIENPDLLIWLNRMSDYLWLLARREDGESLSLRAARKAADRSAR